MASREKLSRNIFSPFVTHINKLQSLHSIRSAANKSARFEQPTGFSVIDDTRVEICENFHSLIGGSSYMYRVWFPAERHKHNHQFGINDHSAIQGRTLITSQVWHLNEN